MSSINNSYEYYQANQGLLSMLNKNKSGNPLINQIISSNELKYQQKMESMGFSSKNGNSKYKDVDKAATNLLDAMEKLTNEDLYKAETGKEYDNTELVKSVTNYVTTYNSMLVSLNSCGGSLEKGFKSEFVEAYKEKTKEFEAIGITMNSDYKLSLDQEKLNAAKPEDVKKLFAKASEYTMNISSISSSIDTIINKALSMRSSNYNASGLMI